MSERREYEAYAPRTDPGQTTTGHLWSAYDADNLASAHLHAGLGFRVAWRGDVGFPGQPGGSRWVLVQRLLGK